MASYPWLKGPVNVGDQIANTERVAEQKEKNSIRENAGKVIVPLRAKSRNGHSDGMTVRRCVL